MAESQIRTAVVFLSKPVCGVSERTIQVLFKPQGLWVWGGSAKTVVKFARVGVKPLLFDERVDEPPALKEILSRLTSFYPGGDPGAGGDHSLRDPLGHDSHGHFLLSGPRPAQRRPGAVLSPCVETVGSVFKVGVVGPVERVAIWGDTLRD